MRKIIVLLIMLTFVLSSCSIDWNDEKDKKIAKLEKQIQDDTFEKKQECAKKSDTYKKLIDEKNAILNDFEYSFIESFYSMEKNDCLWVLKEDYYYNNISKTMYFLIPSWTLWREWNIDRCLWLSNFSDSSKDSNNCDLFDERLKKLKWE